MALPFEHDGGELNLLSDPRTANSIGLSSRGVELNRVERLGGSELFGRNQMPDGGCPGRSVDGGSKAEGEGEAQQRPGSGGARKRGDAEQRGDREHPAWRAQQQAPAGRPSRKDGRVLGVWISDTMTEKS